MSGWIGVNGSMDEWVSGWMDEWIHGWMGVKWVNLSLDISLKVVRIVKIIYSFNNKRNGFQH